MLCPNCGKDNPQGAPFCSDCGKSLASDAPVDAISEFGEAVKTETVVETPAEPIAQNAVQPASTEQASTGYSQASTGYSAGSAGYSSGAGSVPPVPPVTTPPVVGSSQYNNEPWRAYQQQPVQPAVTYAKGCLSAAWSDVTNSPSWFSRMLLLGLISLVPILNFVTMGYAMRWSRQLMLDRVEPMPKQIFVPRAFVNGFFAVVISLVISIVVSICSAILGIIPLLGAFAAIALSIFAAMFEYVAIMRTAVADRLGAGFDISQVWRTFKRNMGELFCSSILPGLIVGVIVSIVMVIGIMICMAFSFGSIVSVGSMAYDEVAQAMLILEILVSMFPVFLIMMYIICVLQSFVTVLTMRAVGHYVARFAQEWKGEAAVMSTAFINGD